MTLRPLMNVPGTWGVMGGGGERGRREGKSKGRGRGHGGDGGLCKGGQLSMTRGPIPDRIISYLTHSLSVTLCLTTSEVSCYTIKSSTFPSSCWASTKLPGFHKWGMLWVITQWPQFSSVSHRETVATFRAYPCCGWSQGHKASHIQELSTALARAGLAQLSHRAASSSGQQHLAPQRWPHSISTAPWAAPQCHPAPRCEGPAAMTAALPAHTWDCVQGVCWHLRSMRAAVPGCQHCGRVWRLLRAPAVPVREGSTGQHGDSVSGIQPSQGHPPWDTLGRDLLRSTYDSPSDNVVKLGLHSSA